MLQNVKIVSACQSKNPEAITLPTFPSPPRMTIRALPPTGAHAHGLLAKFKATWIGKAYEKYVKPYPLLRRVIIFLWQRGYASYLTVFLHIQSEWRPLTPLQEAANEDSMKRIVLAPASLVKTATPAVTPAHEQHLIAPQTQFAFPEVYVTKVRSAKLHGGTNFVWADDRVYHHDLYDFRKDYTSEELHGRALIRPEKKQISWHIHDASPETIPSAATFIDACAANYAHWLTEVLPRIAVFCNQERLKEIPIVLNAGLHENMLASVAMVSDIARTFIALPIGRTLNVSELYVTSCAGYIPFQRRKNSLEGHSHGTFNSHALRFMCEKIAHSVPYANDASWPEKIYLKRTSKVRCLINNAEVEAYFKGLGYVIINPEELTFAQQFHLFRNAKKIIGPTGAAMANLIFAQPEADIFIIISKMPDMIYWYWQNMACATGKKIRYILGDTLNKKCESIHDDFSISLSDLRSESHNF